MAYIDDVQTQKANVSYIRHAMDEPLLERDEERELAIRWKNKGDEKALHKLVRAYARLVIAMASKFRHYGLPMGDLIQEGNIGLMQAAERFDPEREVRFSTYATWWIRAAIQDYVLRNWSIVRTGTTAAQKALFFNLRRLKSKIENDNDGACIDDEGRKEIADKLNVRLSDVHDMESRLSGGDRSLNAPMNEEGDEEFQNLLPDSTPSPEDVVIGMKDAESRSRWLKEALSKLDSRERNIISQRHLSDEVVTLETLGQQLGISKERVRQLETRAMDKLRASVSRHLPDGTSPFSMAS